MTAMESVMARVQVPQYCYAYYDNYWRPDRTDALYAAHRKSWDGTSSRGIVI